MSRLRFMVILFMVVHLGACANQENAQSVGSTVPPPISGPASPQVLPPERPGEAMRPALTSAVPKPPKPALPVTSAYVAPTSAVPANIAIGEASAAKAKTVSLFPASKGGGQQDIDSERLKFPLRVLAVDRVSSRLLLQLPHGQYWVIAAELEHNVRLSNADTVNLPAQPAGLPPRAVKLQ